MRLFLIIFFWAFPAVLHAGKIEIKYFQKDARYTYRIELLKLALEKSKESGEVIIFKAFKESLTQSRGLYYLKNDTDKVNIAFIPTSKEREKNYYPINIPILRGLLGYRIFLIHKSKQQEFSDIKSISEFRNGSLLCGFGSQWADIDILKFNKITVRGVPVYNFLFKMLEHKRFDYFPRGVNEVFKEIEIFKDQYPNIAVEKDLAFYYPYHVYYFVNKKDTYLAGKIEKGLKLAEKDGSFKRLFLKFHKENIQRVKLSGRRIFYLKNPDFPEDEKIDKSWWF